MLTEVKILHSQHLIQDKYNTIGYHRNYSGHWLVATMSTFKSTIILQCTSKRTRSGNLSHLRCLIIFLSTRKTGFISQLYAFLCRRCKQKSYFPRKMLLWYLLNDVTFRKFNVCLFCRLFTYIYLLSKIYFWPKFSA